MSVSGATQSAFLDSSRPVQIPPELTYECAEGGFYYTVAHSARGREFVSLPGFTATQVQELIEGSNFYPPEKFDDLSFGFMHRWPVDRYTVGIAVEDGVLCCIVKDETGSIIHDEEIPQTDGDGSPLPAGEIYCRYSRLTPFINADGKVSFFCFVRPKREEGTLPTWEWGDKTLSLMEDDGQFMWQLFDRATKTTCRIPFASTWLENPDENFYVERFYNEFPPEDCPKFLLDQERVNVGQLLECASEENKEVLIHRITKLIQTYFLKVCVTPDNQIQSVLFRPSTAYISTQSRLDPKITVSESRWAVTLVNSRAPDREWPFGHAVLLIEKVKDGRYKLMRAHFTVDGDKKDALFGISPGKVEHYEVPPSCRYHSKTETWSLPRFKVERMIAEIKKEKRMQEQGTPVLFSGPGSETIFTSASIQTPDGPRRVENCLTWAVDKLLKYGAEFYHLPEGIFMNRPATYISSYERSRDSAKETRSERVKAILMVRMVEEICGIDSYRRIKIPPLYLSRRRSLEERLIEVGRSSNLLEMGVTIFCEDMCMTFGKKGVELSKVVDAKVIKMVSSKNFSQRKKS